MSSLRLTPLLFVAALASASAQSDGITTCPNGSDDVRVIALSSLAQLDPDQVLPSLKKILERRDACSVTLRRQAIGFLNRSRYGDQTDLLLNVARNDPAPDVRRYAVQMLAQSANERGASALDSIVFGSGDAELRDVALRALAQQSAPTARASVRRAAEMTSLPVEVRVRAVNALGSPRRDMDETSYLSALYAKADRTELRDAIMRAIANQRTAAAASWLLGVAKDRTKDIDVRRQALSAIGSASRSGEGATGSGMDIKGLIGLYDDFAGQTEMQDRVLDVMSQHTDSAVTDKLLQVARTESNMELRRKAVIRVGQRRDPRVREFLLDVLSK